jgi:hypothetical protein
MPCLDASDLFPPADGNVEVEGIEFDHSSDPAGALRREYRGAAATERVENDASAAAAVAHQVGDEGDGL